MADMLFEHLPIKVETLETFFCSKQGQKIFKGTIIAVKKCDKVNIKAPSLIS